MGTYKFRIYNFRIIYNFKRLIQIGYYFWAASTIHSQRTHIAFTHLEVLVKITTNHNSVLRKRLTKFNLYSYTLKILSHL